MRIYVEYKSVNNCTVIEHNHGFDVDAPYEDKYTQYTFRTTAHTFSQYHHLQYNTLEPAMDQQIISHKNTHYCRIWLYFGTCHRNPHKIILPTFLCILNIGYIPISKYLQP